jgi:hypothetical protein
VYLDGKKKFYIAGPMTGLPDFNFDAFDEAAAKLRSLGLTVANPAEIDHGETLETRGKTKPYKNYLAAAIVMMIHCTDIVLLPGWAKSKGARYELDLAITCGHGVYYYLRQEPWIMEIK